jgi:N-methylhydantoinase A
MASAVKQITIERGLDPRDFAMVAFGGGGPLHAGTLARDLGIAEVIIPPEPGIFSALGMILADARVDETRTFLRPLSDASAAEMAEGFAQMEAEVSAALAQELGATAVLFERQAEMRFRGQRHTMKTPIGGAATEATIRAAFEGTYRQRFGHVSAGAPIEFVGLVLTASAGLERPRPADLRPALPSAAPAAAPTRMVHFAERGGRVATPVLSRAALPIGYAAAGPAVIEEYGSTIVVGPDDRFAVGPLGEIRISFDGAAR